MEVEKININDINPAEYNPRIMPTAEMEKLKKGLKTHGLIDPIIIDLTDNNTVIGGHQRLEALKELYPEKTLNLIKLGNIGWVFDETNLQVKDKNDQKAKNLSLNKITGDWDYALLDEILLDLSEAHYDIELTGFDETDIKLDIEENNILDNIIFKEEEPNKINEDGTVNDPKIKRNTIICPRCQHEFQP